jgi:hypothetical protein
MSSSISVHDSSPVLNDGLAVLKWQHSMTFRHTFYILGCPNASRNEPKNHPVHTHSRWFHGTSRIVSWTSENPGCNSLRTAYPIKIPFPHAVVWGSRIQKMVSVVYLRIQCDPGVHIKIYISAFKNPDPYPFALRSFWFAYPDWVQIRFYLHLYFRSIFDGPDPRIQTHLQISFSSFNKNSLEGFW